MLSASTFLARRNLIISRATARKMVRTGSAFLPGLIAASASEVREEFAATVTPQTQSVSFIDDAEEGENQTHLAEVVKNQCFDSVSDGTPIAVEKDCLLTQAEKAQLVRDVDALRWNAGKAKGLWLALVS